MDEIAQTVVSDEMWSAYRETEYRVLGESPTILLIDRASSSLAAMHKVSGVECSAFITACNPRSEAFDDQTNLKLQKALAEEIRRRGFKFVDGVGRHPSNHWPGEPSFLVFGLALEAAKALGRQLEQNAIVWAGADAKPTLVLLR